MLAAFSLGLAAGLLSSPHCVAMCGPLATFACAQARSRYAVLNYQAGRLLGYGLLGAIAGWSGHALRQQLTSAWASALWSWLLAFVLGLTAVRLLRKPNSLVSTQRLRRENRVATLWSRLAARLSQRPTALGALTGLLPCGALASALVIAAGTGSIASGLLCMVGFALASGIGLIALGWMSHRVSLLRQHWARLALASVFMAGGVVFALRPLPALLRQSSDCCAASGSNYLNTTSAEARVLKSHL